MALDKLVDSTQLDSDLTSVANAIRTKGGTSAALAFPADFVSAINAISGGGGTEITTAGDYTINAGDTITMGSGLTGALTASGQRVLTNSWDFTSGLVDSVGGLTVTLANGATQDSTGLTISNTTQYASIPLRLTPNETYELDFSSVNKTYSSGHGRVFMFTGSEGLILQSGSSWNTYTSGQWNQKNNGTTIGAFSGKTLRMTTHGITSLANGSQFTYMLLRFYIDGTLWFSPIFAELQPTAYLSIGAASNSFATMVITGFRVYSGVNV